MSRKVGKKDNRYLAKLVTEDRAPCAFCRREVDDEVTYGKLYTIGDIQCHYFCALLSCCLVQKGPEEEGLFGFMYKDILAELERSKKHKCSFCGRGGANLGCSVASCRKQFHLPCGRDRNAVSLYYGSYKSFCQIHAPNQRIPEHIMCKAKLRMKGRNKNKISTDLVNGDNTTDEEMVCVICYEAVDAFPTVNTFWPPCCARDAWFHRTCLQRMALSAGMHYLKCPLCNDKQSFYEAVVSQGYYVPDRDAAWELEQNAFAEIYERPLTCTVEDCQCPMGRSHDADQGMWDIKLCLLCGSVGAHAQCMGASETSRYVCLTCTPAAPPDMQALAETIEKLILQEQANTASGTRHGPVMPSRMSLRRTKGRLDNFASSSRARDFKTEYASLAPSPNIQSSRQELNLNTPRKLIQLNKSDSYKNMDSPRKPSMHAESNRHEDYLLSPIKLPNPNLNVSNKNREAKLLTPIKLLNQSLNDLYKTTEPYKNIEQSLNESFNHTDSYKNMEAKLLSPMKVLEQIMNEKCMEVEKAVLDENVLDTLRRKLKKPRPLFAKKKIANDILDSLFDNMNSLLKQKDAVREWSSPRKCYDITDKETLSTASENVAKETEITVENKENCIQETPKKYKRILPNKNEDTPKTLSLNDNNDLGDASIIESPRVNDNNELKEASIIKTTRFDDKNELEDVSNNKRANKIENIEESHTDPKEIADDESSNSTFQLPSEFIAETLSDDSCMEFSSQKRKIIEIKQDSSLEISEHDHSVNIDVVKIDDSPSDVSKKLDGDMKKKCAFKFSPLDKEKLEENNVGIDLESFKKEYLNEVGREFKCCFDHKHDNSTTSLEKAKFRTVIDFAIDAHLNVAHVKRNKRKLSEGSLILSFDKSGIKKRKMSENDLGFSFSNSSDDFEMKQAFKSPAKQETGNVEVDKVRELCHPKNKQLESESRKERVKIMSFKDKMKIDEKRELKDEEKSLLERKQEREKDYRKKDSERTRVKDTLLDSEKSVQKKSVRNEERNVKDEEKSLLDRKLESKEKHRKKIKLDIKRKNIKELKNLAIRGKNRKPDNKRRRVKNILNSEERVREKITQDMKLKDEDKRLKIRKLDIEEKRKKVKELESEKRRVKDRNRDRKRKHIKDTSLDNGESVREKLVHDDNRELGNEENNLKDIITAPGKQSVKDKQKKRDNKSEKNAKDRKNENDQSIEVIIDSSKKKINKKSKNKLKTKLSISNNEKDISVRIKWKKKQLRLKIESKKGKSEKDKKDHSKFKQYVLQYFSEVTPKEVLVKPEKDVSPLKRKYVKQEKTPDKFKQMSIQNFFKVKSPTE